MDHSSDTPQQPSAAPTPVAGAVVSQRRRRFIQAGVVPVGLTLASRPVMAWHCNTTSAWGSAVLRNGAASVKARASAAVINNTECWTVVQWRDNTTAPKVRNGALPWNFAIAKWCSGKSVADARLAITVAQVFPKGLKTVSGNLKIYDVLQKTSSYGALMLTARLNTLFAQNGVAQCVIAADGSDQLEQIAKLGPNAFKPLNSSGAYWNEDDIRNYLASNWLVA